MNQTPQPSAPGGSGFRAFRSFRITAFRFYLPGALFQFTALSLQIFTGPLLMFRLTNSTAALGIMALISALPMIFVSMYGGAIADRISKKKIIVTGLTGTTVVALLLGTAVLTGVISSENPWSYWLLILGVLLIGTAMGAMMPSLQAMVAEIVSRDLLMNAVAIQTMGMNVLMLVGPVVAGVLIDNVGFHAVFYTMAGVYVCSAFFILMVPLKHRPQPQRTEQPHIFRQIREGFRYIRGHPVLLTVLAVSLGATVLAQPYQQLLPVFIDDILKVDATRGSVLMSVSGVGALVGSVALSMLPNRKRGLLLLLSGVIAGLALLVFSFSAVWGISISVMAFIGLGQTFRMTVGSTLLQVNTVGEYRGRVMSIFSMQWGLMGTVTFIAGLISERLPVQAVLGTLSALLVVGSLIAIWKLPVLRKLD